jgi:transposase InsO family protein
MPLRVVSDGGPENKAITNELLTRYGIKHTWTSAYHPQANGMVERGHQPVVNALAKHVASTGARWVNSLPAMLWADRTIVKSTTGITPVRVIYRSEHILPIEIDVRS